MDKNVATDMLNAQPKPQAHPQTSAITPEHSADAGPPQLRTSDQPERRFGLLVLLVAFGGFGVWSAVAPIDSAAVAPGVVAVESARKTVQHLDGGFVDAILVREGDRVSAKQPLVRLDDTEPRAQLEITRGNYFAVMAEEARLIAERDGADEVEFPQALLSEREDARAVDAMAGQRRLFQSRRTDLLGEMEVQRQRIEQLQEQIRGYQALIASKKRRVALYREEIAALNTLVGKGFSDKTRLREWERLVAELKGENSEHRSTIAGAQVQITETELQITQLQRRFNTEVAERLGKLQPQVFDLREQIRALETRVARTKILAPVSGSIVNLTVHTEGGIVEPGQRILDIVPQGDRLIIEAEVLPDDIDRVFPSLEADVHFTAFNVATTPVIPGRVLTVSGDRLIDQTTGQPYFLARIQITEDGMSKLEGLELMPGMSATVMIKTGSQTLFNYLVKPFSDRVATAFREE